MLSTELSYILIPFNNLLFWGRGGVGWDWSLNSGLHAHKAGVLPLEPHLQFATTFFTLLTPKVELAEDSSEEELLLSICKALGLILSMTKININNAQPSLPLSKIIVHIP
jgi:hypothetical protein